jgi:hypothetical protein
MESSSSTDVVKFVCAASVNARASNSPWDGSPLPESATVPIDRDPSLGVCERGPKCGCQRSRPRRAGPSGSLVLSRRAAVLVVYGCHVDATAHMVGSPAAASAGVMLYQLASCALSASSVIACGNALVPEKVQSTMAGRRCVVGVAPVSTTQLSRKADRSLHPAVFARRVRSSGPAWRAWFLRRYPPDLAVACSVRAVVSHQRKNSLASINAEARAERLSPLRKQRTNENLDAPQWLPGSRCDPAPSHCLCE